ncbi:SDR family NAD(P)-dependent oxidoreductase [Crossiella cryophila]|uniref:3-oxoacyl-[acyl-carrier protein] reductase n=1 Tax=Crossiella cryophila TaxID=43355 RepID=A0A7W7CE13_9PSEU|nr:SDR family oxidoreductase [Crossiella cryophila]MBB4679395.1 3-oxoacyl-[acyl-carrier protein] reductase [Crossiella cryophila]
MSEKTITAGPLSGRVALVTGGSRGVGAAAVRRLAADGARVAFSYLNAADRAREVAESVPGSVAFRADVGEDAEMVRLVEDTVRHFGRLDILVHNAALFHGGPLTDPGRDEALLARQFRTNLHGVVAGTRAAAAHLGEGGRIILISTAGSDRSNGLLIGDYAATKAALEAYGRAWTHEFGPRGITVNSIRPGAVDTDMLDRAGAAAAVPSIPLRRIGTPEEIADAIAYLAGPSAGYITGAVLRIDGGLYA